MQYVHAPRVDLKISILSFGTMRFSDEESAVEAVRRAVDLGVTYFDVAPGYGNGVCEEWLGKGLSGLRDKVIVTAKSGTAYSPNFNSASGFGVTTAEQARQMIEKSMQVMGVDHLDVYSLWCVYQEENFETAIRPGGFFDGVFTAKSEGLVDHVGITTHLDSAAAIRCLERVDVDVLTINFNLLDRSRAEAIRYCGERGIPVVAMNPLGGGILANGGETFDAIARDLGMESMLEAALRYIISFPGVSALSGIATARHAETGAGAVDKGPLDEATLHELESRIEALCGDEGHMCTGCGYCGECPQGIRIPEVLRLYTRMLFPASTAAARADLEDCISRDADAYNAARCISCGACEEHCPNGLPVAGLMKTANEHFRGRELIRY